MLKELKTQSIKKARQMTTDHGPFSPRSNFIILFLKGGIADRKKNSTPTARNFR